MTVSRNYFQKFPTISYGDYVVRDISLRTKLTQYIVEAGIALLPYTVKEGERADSIASFYYEDPYYAWAIYLANGIVDPYSEWPKDTATFNEYIEKKYGSFENALDTIVGYEVDWASDTTLLSPEQYEALFPEEKKYWDSQFGYAGEIISYYRRPLDAVKLNNRIDQLTVIATNNHTSSLNSWVIGERLYQKTFAGDVAVKSTLISVDDRTESNTTLLRYSNASFYDINFTVGNTVIFVKTSSNILPTANIQGTGIPPGTYVKSVVNGNYISISSAPTSSPSPSIYTVTNPATAVITVDRVDFFDVVFKQGGQLKSPNSFFTYVKNMDSDGGTNAVFTSAYSDSNNSLIGRKSNTTVIVLDQRRLDDPGDSSSADSRSLNPANALLANSYLSNTELKYWKSINAYEYEQQLNEKRKEIFVLDALMINKLDEELEKLLGNV